MRLRGPARVNPTCSPPTRTAGAWRWVGRVGRFPDPPPPPRQICFVRRALAGDWGLRSPPGLQTKSFCLGKPVSSSVTWNSVWQGCMPGSRCRARAEGTGGILARNTGAQPATALRPDGHSFGGPCWKWSVAASWPAWGPQGLRDSQKSGLFKFLFIVRAVTEGTLPQCWHQEPYDWSPTALTGGKSHFTNCPPGAAIPSKDPGPRRGQRTSG